MAPNPTFSTPNMRIFFQSQRAGFNAQLVSELVNFIQGTQQSLDCAIYDLRHPDVLNALAQIASHNSISLRIAFDAGKQRSGGLAADPKPSGTEQQLADAGLLDFAHSIHEGSHLMHNKFLVRDGSSVWTGSANFTVGGLEQQDNNCLILASAELAQRYTAVFEDLISSQHSHSHSQGSQPADESVSLDGMSITPFFSPAMGESIEQAIINALTGANRVRVIAFLVSDAGILNALATFGNDPNADIRGVYDPNGMNDVLHGTHQDPSLFWFTNDSRFVAAPSHAFNPHGEQNFMHNKVMIIDDHLVITGSYNFSENAELNDENLLIIDSAQVAAAYTAYFEGLYSTYGGTV